MLTLGGRALLSVRRHAPVYFLTACAITVAQIVVVYLWHARDASLIAITVAPPFFVTIVNAFTFADCSDEQPQATWLRVLERSWAVLVIDVLLSFVGGIGFGSIVSPLLIDRILGTGILVIFVSLVFADVHATVGNAEPWWLIVPRSLVGSMAVAWQGTMFARAMIVFAVSVLLPSLVESLLQGAFILHHAQYPDLWASAATNLLIPFVQAFTALIYLDAIKHE
jgi:hypothetical protein